MVAGGILKLMGIPVLAELYKNIGLWSYWNLLGAMELLFATLFLWKTTMRLGFLLLTGYLGGAMSVELSYSMLFVAPGLILVLVWISAYLRGVFILPNSTTESMGETRPL